MKASAPRMFVCWLGRLNCLARRPLEGGSRENFSRAAKPTEPTDIVAVRKRWGGCVYKSGVGTEYLCRGGGGGRGAGGGAGGRGAARRGA